MFGIAGLEPGPVVVLMCHLMYLLPHYYLLNALIIAGRKDAEWTLRNAVLQSQVALGVVEMMWAAWCPEGLSYAACTKAALVAFFLQGIHVVLAFCAPSNIYTSSLALLVHSGVLAMQILVAQIGNNYTLQRRISPARFRIMGWLIAVTMAIVVLLVPSAASLAFAVPLSVLPSLAIVLVLHFSKTDQVSTADSVSNGSSNGHTVDKDADNPAGAQCDKASGEEHTSSSESDAKPGQLHTGLYEAGVFVILGCGFGTIGEAFTDMATALAIRKSLQAGRQDLALTNHLMVLVSMVLAYWSETRKSVDGRRKAIIFILAWAACQSFRVCSLQHLESDSFGTLVLGGMVFMDKYTGPLGASALESALLDTLSAGDERRQAQKSTGLVIPGATLWTLRMIVARMERPICQLILLRCAGVRVELLSSAFSAMTVMGVLAIFSRSRLTGLTFSQRMKQE